MLRVRGKRNDNEYEFSTKDKKDYSCLKDSVTQNAIHYKTHHY